MTLSRVFSDHVVRFHNAFFEEIVVEGRVSCCVSDESDVLLRKLSGNRMYELFVATEYCGGG
jgi:hypothetical protein